MPPVEHELVSQTIRRIEGTIADDDEALRTTHAKNMSDLDDVLRKLKATLGEPVAEEIADFNMTMQYDAQKVNLASQLQVVQKNGAQGVFNPFESKINEHSEEDDAIDELRSD